MSLRGKKKAQIKANDACHNSACIEWVAFFLDADLASGGWREAAEGFKGCEVQANCLYMYGGERKDVLP